MVKLIAKPVFDPAVLRHIGGIVLSSPMGVPVTSIAPYQGCGLKVASTMLQATGLAWPEANGHAANDVARLLWVGPGRSLLIGTVAPDLTGLAAVTDQTGAEAVLHVAGVDAEDVLARLVPIDLRLGQFGPGITVRTMIAHMMGSVTRLRAEAIELRVMRSMAGTLLHDVTQAATLFAAR